MPGVMLVVELLYFSHMIFSLVVEVLLRNRVDLLRTYFEMVSEDRVDLLHLEWFLKIGWTYFEI